MSVGGGGSQSQRTKQGIFTNPVLPQDSGENHGCINSYSETAAEWTEAPRGFSQGQAHRCSPGAAVLGCPCIMTHADRLGMWPQEAWLALCAPCCRTGTPCRRVTKTTLPLALHGRFPTTRSMEPLGFQLTCRISSFCLNALNGKIHKSENHHILLEAKWQPPGGSPRPSHHQNLVPGPHFTSIPPASNDLLPQSMHLRASCDGFVQSQEVLCRPSQAYLTPNGAEPGRVHPTSVSCRHACQQEILSSLGKRKKSCFGREYSLQLLTSSKKVDQTFRASYWKLSHLRSSYKKYIHK